MANLTNLLKEFSTLKTVQKIFGNTEFTKKQYEYVNIVTGNNLMGLDGLTGFPKSGVVRETEPLFTRHDGSPNDKRNDYILHKGCVENVTIDPALVDALPKEAKVYVEENRVKTLSTEKRYTAYRYVYHVDKKRTEKRLDELKNQLKYNVSDAYVNNIQAEIDKLVNKIKYIKDVRETLGFEDES